MNTREIRPPPFSLVGRSWARAGLTSILLVCLTFGLTGLAEAAAVGETWVIYRAKVPLFQAICHALITSGAHVIPCPLETMSNTFLESHPPKIMITLGEAAAQRALKTNWDVPIVSLFAETVMPDPRFRFLDMKPPIERQVNLLRRLCPRLSCLYVPYATKELVPIEALRRAAKESSMQVSEEHLPEPRSWKEFFRKLSEEGGAVWLPVDPRLVNQAFLESLLTESFRSRTPIIGFSESQVRQGALFAFIVNPDKVSRAVWQYIEDIQMSEVRERSSRPFPNWELIINSTIAGKFGLVIPPDLLETAHRVF